MKRFATIFVLLVLVVVGAYYGYRRWQGSNPAAAEPQGQIVPVERGRIEATISATGLIQPKRQARLSFKSGGRIATLAVEQGQHVAVGDLLATLETEELDLQVRQAQIALQIAEERLAITERGATPEDLAAAEAGLKSAQESLARIKRGPTPEQLAAAEASLKAAEESYAKLQAGPTAEALRRAKLAIDQAKNTLWGAQNSRDSLGYQAQLGGSRAQYDQAQANVLNAEIAVELAEMSYQELLRGPDAAQLQAALAQVQQARDAYQQLKEAPRPSDIAVAEAQVAQAAATLAKLRAGASEEEKRIARAQVEQARLSLQQAQLLLDGAQLRAPFDGVVAAVLADEKALVTAATPVVQLVDLSTLHVDVNVDEVDVAAVREGQPVVLTLDALADTEVKGTVVSVSPLPAADASIVAYTVRIDLTPTDAPLKVGMTATAQIITESRDGVLLIPNRAIRVNRQAGTFSVEKWVNGRIVEADIVVGLRSDLQSEVISGLQDGDQLIIRTISFQQQLRQTFGGMMGQ